MEYDHSKKSIIDACSLTEEGIFDMVKRIADELESSSTISKAVENMEAYLSTASDEERRRGRRTSRGS